MGKKLGCTTRWQDIEKSKLKTPTTILRGEKPGMLFKKFTNNISTLGPASDKDGDGEKDGKLGGQSRENAVATPILSTRRLWEGEEMSETR